MALQFFQLLVSFEAIKLPINLRAQKNIDQNSNFEVYGPEIFTFRYAIGFAPNIMLMIAL